MASGTRLELGFEDKLGKTITMSFNYAKQQPGWANIKNLIDTIIQNGDIFENVPVKAKSAKEVVTSETDYSYKL